MPDDRIDRESKTRSASDLRQEQRSLRRAELQHALTHGPDPAARQTRRERRRQRIKDWIMAVLLGLDILLSSLIFGTHYQTISEQAGYAAREGKAWGLFTCALLNLPDPNHCEDVIEGRKHK